MTKELIAELEALLGEEGLVLEPGRLLSYESDALTRIQVTPEAVLLPASTEEAAAAVRILVAAGIPLTPRGAGTGLAGGSVACPGGVLLGTARMDRILELDPNRRRARVQAGVVNTELSRAAAPYGLHYAPDPSSQTACTLGGNVGSNAGGPHCLKYGVTTRYVTGLTVVTGAGEVVELGGMDRCEDLDLVGLFVGSEGRLGLATEVELLLTPLPRAVRTLLGVFPSMEAAGTAVTRIIAEGLVPAAMEIMDRGTIEAVESSVFAAGYPRDAGAVLVIEFDGTEEGLDAAADRAAHHCTEAGATQVRRAASETERQALWQGRKKAYGAFGRITPDLMVQDATVPRSTLPEVLRRIEEIGRRYDLRVANVFHAGDGNLHPKILYDRRDPELVTRVERASKKMMQVCVEAGGTITGEHGVGLDKRDYMPLVHGPEELELMRRVQKTFDPAGFWNPGKVLPEPSGAEPAAHGTPGSAARDSAHAPGGPTPVFEHAPADLTLTVSGDATLESVQERLAEAGQWLPTDVPGWQTLTVAQWVETGAWGPLAPAYGRTRDLVLGVELDTPAHGVLRLGGRVMKNVAGFDLVRAVVGARGRWGRVRSATLRLQAIPRGHAVLVWEGEPWAMMELAGSLRVQPILPASLVRLGGDVRSGVLLRLLGSPEQVEAEAVELMAAFPGGARWDGDGPGAGFLEADPLSRSLAKLAHGVRVEARPGRLDPLELDAALESLPGGVPPFFHLPLWDVWRATFHPGTPAVPAVHDLAAALRREGGDACMIGGQPLLPEGTELLEPWSGAPGLRDAVARLLDPMPAGVASAGEES